VTHIPVFKSQPDGQSSAATTHIPFMQVDGLLPEHWLEPGAHTWHLPSMQWTDSQSECALQVLPMAHGEQNPPQSTSDSSPFRIPSAQSGIGPSIVPGMSIDPTSPAEAASAGPASLVGLEGELVSELQPKDNVTIRETQTRAARAIETFLAQSFSQTSSR
jgi:hypothetical protein